VVTQLRSNAGHPGADEAEAASGARRHASLARAERHDCEISSKKVAPDERLGGTF